MVPDSPSPEGTFAPSSVECGNMDASHDSGGGLERKCAPSGEDTASWRGVRGSCCYFPVGWPTAARAVVQFAAMARCIEASGTRPLHTSDFALRSIVSFGFRKPCDGLCPGEGG